MPAQRDKLAILRPFVVLACIGIVLCILYFAKAVLIPLALAILLTFLLAPVVTALERRGLPRLPSVFVVAICAFAIFAALGWVVASQATSLVDSIPQYEQNLEEKIGTMRAMSRGGLIDDLQIVMDRIRRRIEQPSSEDSAAATIAREAAPQPVRIVDDEGPFNLAALWSLAGPLLEPFATAGLVVVLVIFMLIRREDMRDRLISLLGRGRLTLTTRALDDAGSRISRYLLMQLIINSSFGAAIALGLFIIQVPYALLWGFLAAVLRYIPYLGPWLAALLPLALSILITRGWTTPLLIVGLFLVLEVATNVFMEPWLYGRNVGVSDAASIIAIAFWTWLWGPIGLVLAFPLTVCLAVLGRHVPSLKFFDTLLGDHPALEPHIGFYQRVLARDQDEASDIAGQQLKQTSLERVYDELLVPALNYARRDLDGDLISDEEHKAMLASIYEISEELAEQNRLAAQAPAEPAHEDKSPRLPRLTMLACPARDETDETAVRMLEHLVDSDQSDFQVVTSALLSMTEVAGLVEERGVKLVCIGALPPGGLAHARYLCMRLRARFPHLKIAVGRWGLKSPLEQNREQLQAAGADYVAFSLAETRNQLQSLVPFVATTKALEENQPAQSARLIKQPA